LLVSILLFGLDAQKVHFRSELFTGIRFWEATVRLTIFTWMYSAVLGKVPVTGQQRGSRRTPIRVHRINAATSERSAGAKTNCPNDGVEQETPNEAKKNSQNVKHFSLKGFAGFLPISKIRRRLSLDSSPTSSDGK